MKKCSKCLIEKDFDLFAKNRAACKSCIAIYKKKYKEANKEKIARQNKVWDIENHTRVLTNKKKYYQKNKSAILTNRKKWINNNKSKYLEYMRSYKNNREQQDVCFKISRRLRNRLKDAIKNNQKSGSAVSDLGCSIVQFKAYLETKFQSGMSWNNWSLSGWHIDHVRPLSSFDLSNPEQVKRACHYTNLQPLWAKDNLMKGDK